MIIIISIISLAILFSIFFVTDSIRCKNDKDPIFCIHYGTYKDGGSKHFIGLGYNYYKILDILAFSSQRPIGNKDQ